MRHDLFSYSKLRYVTLSFKMEVTDLNMTLARNKMTVASRRWTILYQKISLKFNIPWSDFPVINKLNAVA